MRQFWGKVRDRVLDATAQIQKPMKFDDLGGGAIFLINPEGYRPPPPRPVPGPVAGPTGQWATGMLGLAVVVAVLMMLWWRMARHTIKAQVLDGRNGRVLALLSPGQEVIVGRSSSAGICLDRDQLSQQHARFGLDSHGLWIEDLASKNGVWFGPGKQLVPGKREPLKNGDVIYLADDQSPIRVVLSAQPRGRRKPVAAAP